MKKINKLQIFFVALIISSIIPLKVFAYDVDFYSNNDILFYNPDETDCIDSAQPFVETTLSDSDAAVNERIKTTATFLTGKGLSLAAAAGIIGNLKKESGINPAKIAGGAIAPDDYKPVNGLGFGIAQWTFPSRQDPLVELAASSGRKITDLGLQLDFMWKEMNSNTYKAMFKRLNAIKDNSTFGSASAPMAATIIFHGWTNEIWTNPPKQITDVNFKQRGFEASADSAATVIGVRGGTAEAVYKKYKGTITSGTGVAGIDTSGDSTNYESSSSCGSDNAVINGVVAGNIVQTAKNLASPSIVPDGHFRKSDALPSYITARQQYNPGIYAPNGEDEAYSDCGRFVSTTLRASKADPDYPIVSVSKQLEYVKENPKKFLLIPHATFADLKPGDVLIISGVVIPKGQKKQEAVGHTIIFTGDAKNPMIEASLGDNVPGVQSRNMLTWVLNRDATAVRIIKE